METNSYGQNPAENPAWKSPQKRSWSDAGWVPTQAALLNAVVTGTPDLKQGEKILLLIYVSQLDNKRLAVGDARIYCAATLAAALAGFSPASIKAIKGRLVEAGFVAGSGSAHIDLAPLVTRYSALRGRARALREATLSRRAGGDQGAVEASSEGASANAAGGRSAKPHIQTPSYARLSDTCTRNSGAAKPPTFQKQHLHFDEASPGNTETSTSTQDGSRMRARRGKAVHKSASTNLAETPRELTIGAMEACQRLLPYLAGVDLHQASEGEISAMCAKAADIELSQQSSRNCGLYWAYAEQARGTWMAAQLLAYVLDDPAKTGVHDAAKVFSWYGNRQRKPEELKMLSIYMRKAAIDAANSVIEATAKALPVEAEVIPTDARLAEIRAAAKSLIEGRDPSGWRVWYAGAEFRAIEGNTLIVALKSQFMADYLTQRDDDLRRVAEQFGLVRVRFIVGRKM